MAHRLKLLGLIRQEKWRLINAKREEHYERRRQECQLARLKAIEVSIERKRKERAQERAKEKQLVDIERQKRKDMDERCACDLNRKNGKQVLFHILITSDIQRGQIHREGGFYTHDAFQMEEKARLSGKRHFKPKGIVALLKCPSSSVHGGLQR